MHTNNGDVDASGHVGANERGSYIPSAFALRRSAADYSPSHMQFRLYRKQALYFSTWSSPQTLPFSVESGATAFTQVLCAFYLSSNINVKRGVRRTYSLWCGSGQRNLVPLVRVLDFRFSRSCRSGDKLSWSGVAAAGKLDHASSSHSLCSR